MNTLLDLVDRLRQGQSIRSISRDLGICRNTVKKYRHLFQSKGILDPGCPASTVEDLLRQATQGLSGRSGRSPDVCLWLEQHQDLIKGDLERGVEIQVIYQRLFTEHGFQGSYSTLRRFVAVLTGQDREAFCRVETKPGQQAQVDFGYAGIVQGRKVWFFLMVLSWSRHLYVEFVHDQKTETWIRCHERAFAYFGGVPGQVVIDNLKAAVVARYFHDPVLGEPYRRLAKHYGFMISANRPKTPRHKGKVESGVRYVKRNLLAGRRFSDLEAMNQAGLVWAQEHAGTRIHGTTRQMPLQRFNEIERELLGALPGQNFDLVSACQCRVARDCHVVVEGSYYSVPHKYVGDRVDIYIRRRIVEIYSGTVLLVTHERAQQPGQRITRSEDYPAGKRLWLENPPDRCQEKARAIGKYCGQLVEQLLGEKEQDRLRSVHGLLGLAAKYGNKRLEAACKRALHYGDGSYKRVKGILNAGTDGIELETERREEPSKDRVFCFARRNAIFTEEVGR